MAYFISYMQNQSKHTLTVLLTVTMVRQLCLAMDSLSGCLASNRLLLNPTKTQFIWLGSRRRLANVDRCLVAETFPHLVFCDNVRDLGIILDQELNFSAHINQLTINFTSCVLFPVPYLMMQLLLWSMLLLLVGSIIAARF